VTNTISYNRKSENEKTKFVGIDPVDLAMPCPIFVLRINITLRNAAN